MSTVCSHAPGITVERGLHTRLGMAVAPKTPETQSAGETHTVNVVACGGVMGICRQWKRSPSPSCSGFGKGCLENSG